MSKNSTIWISQGIGGNLGDVLLYKITSSFFAENNIPFLFQYAARPLSVEKIKALSNYGNVIIGPGGMFVHTISSKNMYRLVLNDINLREFEEKGFNFVIFSGGILDKPTDEEISTAAKLFQRCKKIYTRANIEIDNIKKITPDVDIAFCPCGSLFTDKIMKVEHRKKDIIVLNLDNLLFTAENYRDHPMKKFRDYALSQGLNCELLVNVHQTDYNEYLGDIFPVREVDLPIYKRVDEVVKSEQKTGYDFWHSFELPDDFVDRYNDCRFAFGKRLHGWLPFMSFDNPSAFIGMNARRQMPYDYFGDDTFLCGIPLKERLKKENLELMTDMMIEKLKYFIKNENLLCARIAARREQLWVEFQKHTREMFELMN
ncbi:hypothetical protein FACS1894208_08220 [Clostridia bacterium]|nr:hypothetical protein FACS1894208_08220 [Clostridia bacterium]